MACMALLTNEQVLSIARRVATGEFVTKILKELQIEPFDFYKSLDSDPELSNSYERARQARTEGLVDEIIEIVDTEPDSQRARNRADARKWMAGKLIPQTYGDRVDVNVAGVIDLRAAITEAGARLLPMRDQQPAIDAEYTEVPALISTEASDKTSDAPKIPAKKAGSIFD